jgi:hypothetical protein
MVVILSRRPGFHLEVASTIVLVNRGARSRPHGKMWRCKRVFNRQILQAVTNNIFGRAAENAAHQEADLQRKRELATAARLSIAIAYGERSLLHESMTSALR